MEAKELRIGNLVRTINRNNEVHLPENIIYKVQEIGFDCILCELDKNPTTQRTLPVFSAIDLEPIPLTEEWLSKFGFTKENGWDDAVFWRKEVNNWHFDLEEGIEGFEFDICTNITRIHHLQNLYFALANEELKSPLNE